MEIKVADLFIVVGTVIKIFLVFLFFIFFSYNFVLINLLVILVLYRLIRKDLKNGNGNYYLASMFLTALCLIFSTFGIGKELLLISERLELSYATFALALIYILANAVAFIYEYTAYKFFPHSHEKPSHGH